MRRAAWAVVAAAVLLPRFGFAAGEDELVSLINARRAEARGCTGATQTAAPPLAPSAALARVAPAATPADLGKSLAAAGYLASHATTIVVSGPKDAAEAARFIEERDCAVVLDARYAEIGIAHSGSTWRIQLARSLLDKNLGDWHTAGQAVLRLVNEARRRGGSCGKQRFAATAPLAWNDSLAAAALAHSRDMAAHDYFDHVDANGAAVAQRARRQGYVWRVVGENIAAGQGSPQQVVAGWLASPGHCANILSPDYAEMGAAYAVDPKAAMEIYWTQVFGVR